MLPHDGRKSNFFARFLDFCRGAAFLSRKSKLPKPDNLTFSLVSSADRISSKKSSTISLASRLFNPSSSNNRSAISALVRAIINHLKDALNRCFNDANTFSINAFTSSSFNVRSWSCHVNPKPILCFTLDLCQHHCIGQTLPLPLNTRLRPLKPHQPPRRQLW